MRKKIRVQDEAMRQSANDFVAGVNQFATPLARLKIYQSLLKSAQLKP